MSVLLIVAVVLAAIPGVGIAALAIFAKPTQEDFDRYGPSYMMRRKP